MNYLRIHPRPVDGDECGGGALGDVIHLLKCFKDAPPCERGNSLININDYVDKSVKKYVLIKKANRQAIEAFL
jgi:hypothetical protein